MKVYTNRHEPNSPWCPGEDCEQCDAVHVELTFNEAKVLAYALAGIPSEPRSVVRGLTTALQELEP